MDHPSKKLVSLNGCTCSKSCQLIPLFTQLIAVEALVTKNYECLDRSLAQIRINIDDEFDLNIENEDCDASLLKFENFDSELGIIHDLQSISNTDFTKNTIGLKIREKREVCADRADNDFVMLQAITDKIAPTDNDFENQFQNEKWGKIEGNVCLCCVNSLKEQYNSVLGYSLLQIACKLGDSRALQIVLSNQPSLNKCAHSGESALHLACKYGHVRCVRLLIDAGANVSLRHHENGGDSPLLTTVASCISGSEMAMNYVVIVRMLLEANCDVNMSDNHGLAPLHIAATKFNSSLLRLLIENGANVNAASAFVEPPLIRAIASKAVANAIVLIDAGCNVNAVLPSNETPLFAAIRNNLLTVVLELLAAGADPGYGPRESCPYHYAVSCGQLIVLYLLLIYKPMVNCTSIFDGASLLTAVCRHRSVTGARLLLSLGADSDQESRLGTTPLFAAVKSRCVEIVRLLLEHNCKTDVLSVEYYVYKPLTPLLLALDMGQWGTAQALLSVGARLTRAHLATGQIARKLRDSPAAARWLDRWLSQPQTLQHLCRITLRAALGQPLAVKLDSISYPEGLKSYILTRHL